MAIALDRTAFESTINIVFVSFGGVYACSGQLTEIPALDGGGAV